jgi:hypothetical protein
MFPKGPRDAQRLTAHLATRRTRLKNDFRCFDLIVEMETGFKVSRYCVVQRPYCIYGIARPDLAGDVGSKHLGDVTGAYDASFADKRLKTERMGIGAGREKSVAELQQGQQFFSPHADDRRRLD